jgi:hypothetical protein
MQNGRALYATSILVGDGNLASTALTYPHVVADERNLDHQELLKYAILRTVRAQAEKGSALHGRFGPAPLPILERDGLRGDS